MANPENPFSDLKFDPEKIPVKTILFIGVPIGLLALAYFTGNIGFMEVKDNQVAVKVNFWNDDTESRELIRDPGFKIFIPIFQKIYTFDKSPIKFEQGSR